jgi:hypothetical protein
MKKEGNVFSRSTNRRSFLTSGTVAAGAATLSAGLPGRVFAFDRDEDDRSQPTQGDIAILRFLAAAEIIEADLWAQYADLGGIGNNPPIELDPTETLNNYQLALSNLDSDGPQYVASNALDEQSHANFLNAYLVSKGAPQVSLEEFRNLPGSTALGASSRFITNLTNLNVDTSWFVRYRSTTNPDLGATFPQAITLNGVTAIPRNPGDLAGTPDPQFPNAVPDHIQAIANVAAFHFGAIEQGGTSLYATLSQKVTSAEVLKITLSIGGDEIAHFLEWVDFSGNAVQAPIAPFTDGISGLSFPNFFTNPPLQKLNLTQPSLIFPVPCEFLHQDLGNVAIIRPTSVQNSGAVAAANGFINSGLFIGQPQKFFRTLLQLAEEADAAQRGF